jgi:hypothetical protein
MDITIFVVGYLLMSVVCTAALVCACIVSGRTQEAGDRVKPNMSRRWSGQATVKVTQPLEDQVAGANT